MHQLSVHLAARVLIAVMLVAGAAGAEEAKPSAAPKPDPEAVKIARRAGDFLRKQKRFAFTADTAYEVLQDDGAKLEFGATRRYLVQRPDRVRVEVAPREGESSVVVFDGDELTVVQPDEKTYAQVKLKEHREIDDAIDTLRERLGIPIPLGELLRSDPREELVGSLTDAFRVGTATIGGTACDHLALRNPETDVQLWIAQGDEPLLRRVVITYRAEEGQPSFQADLRDWSLDPKPTADAFRYTPTPDAQRIRFAVPARGPGADADVTSENHQ